MYIDEVSISTVGGMGMGGGGFFLGPNSKFLWSGQATWRRSAAVQTNQNKVVTR